MGKSDGLQFTFVLTDYVYMNCNNVTTDLILNKDNILIKVFT